MPTLSFVATPIGNLKDITLRAIETLTSVDVILCEDTRVTVKLLSHLGLKKKLISFHEHSDRHKLDDVLDLLRGGSNIALVTDAGTPSVSDPGAWLVREVARTLPEVKIEAIPGASAVAAAISLCGFDGTEFVFMGFPPHKKGRKSFFDRAATEPRITVIYESTHRIMKAMEELVARTGDRPIVVCRELTKTFETTYRGTATEVTELLQKGSIKGEFVIVLGSV